MDYVYVTYFRPTGQYWPSLGILRTKDIDRNIYKPTRETRGGVPVYYKDTE